MQKDLPGPLRGSLAGWSAESRATAQDSAADPLRDRYYRLIVLLVVTVCPALSVTDNVSVHGALPETR